MNLLVCFTQIYVQNTPPPRVEEKSGIDFYKKRIETIFKIKSCLSKTLVGTNLLAEGPSVDCVQDLILNSSQRHCRTSPLWLITLSPSPSNSSPHSASTGQLCRSAPPVSYKYLVYSSGMLWRMHPGCLTPSRHFPCAQVKSKEG